MCGDAIMRQALIFTAVIAVFLPGGNCVACVDECFCSSPGSGLYVVDCSDLSLTQIPLGIPTNTTSLVLANNLLAALTGQPFSTLSELKSLDLSGNPLQRLRTGLLTGLSNLQFLYLSNANIEDIDENIFSSVALTLRVLILSSNRGLTSFSQEVFGNPMPALDQLIIRNAALSYIAPNSFDGLGNLTKLDLSQNDLQSGHFVQLLTSLENLVELRLSRNQISFLNRQVFSGAVALQRLYLDQNPLSGEQISADTFLDTPALNTLWMDTEDISSLGLTTLPESLFDLLNLGTLKLAGTNWNCCGIEWLLNETSLADLAAIVCDRPQRAEGSTLNAAVGSGSVDVDSCSKDLPDTPEAPIVDSIGEAWATVSWAPAHGNAYVVAYYQIEIALNSSCNTDGNYTDCAWRIAQCSTGVQPEQPTLYSEDFANCNISGPIGFGPYDTFSFNITLLDEFSDYVVRAVAFNAIGQNAWDGSGTTLATFSTLDSVPSKPINLRTTASPEQLVLEWDIPLTSNGLIVQYNVHYFNSSGFSGSLSVDGDTRTATISSLAAYKLYSLTVTAVTRAGSGNESDILESRTTEKVPDSPNDTPVANVVESTSVTISWNQLPLGGQHGIITTTTLRQGTSPGTVIYSGTETIVTIENLTPATRYTFYASFTNGAGQSSFGPGLTVTTLNAKPGPPNETTGIPLGETSLLITWTEPQETNGVIVQYEVALREQGSDSIRVSAHDGALIVGESFFTTIKLNLLPATTYEHRVRASTLVNNILEPGNFTEWVVTTTFEGIPGAVPLTADTLSPSSTIVSFHYPTPTNGEITAFTIYQVNKSQQIPLFKPDGSVDESIIAVNLFVPPSNATIGDVFSFIHTGLDAYTNYTYSVTANTTAGESNLGRLTAVALTGTAAPKIQPAPGLVVTGHSTIEATWDSPEFPNGVITAFDLLVDGLLVYTGIPDVNELGRFTHTVVGLDDGKLYEFAVTAVSEGGRSATSSTGAAETVSSAPDVEGTVVITLLCVLIVILTIGMVREREFDSMVMTRASGIHGNFFRRDKNGNISGGFGRDDDESSDSGSEYGHDEVKRPSLERVAHLRKSADLTPQASPNSTLGPRDDILTPVRGQNRIEPPDQSPDLDTQTTPVQVSGIEGATPVPVSGAEDTTVPMPGPNSPESAASPDPFEGVSIETKEDDESNQYIDVV